MSKWTIYHNPRCSKSREALKLLEKNGIAPTIVEYLQNPLSETKLKELIKNSGEDPKKFLRKKEKEFQEFIGIDDSKVGEVAKAIHSVPKLMERPIVIHNEKVVIA